MAIEADRAASVEIVEQHVLLGQGVVIRSDLTAVEDQLGVPIAFGDIAEDLVVGAVFLDDEEDVLDAERR